MPESVVDSSFVCACGKEIRSACVEEPFYKEREGKRYCVLHFPGKEKRADFEKALERKLDKKDFDFQGLWFPDGWNFSKYQFDVKADFSHATFNAEQSFRSITFNAEVDFNHATFKRKALFGKATFESKANFSEVTFKAEVYFYRTTFKTKAIFSSATFNKLANFPSTIFEKGADFHSASFRDYVEFSGSEKKQESINIPSLDFRFTKIEKPDQVSFRTLKLHPNWFVTVDASRFGFFNVDWVLTDINEEIAGVLLRDVLPPHRHLAVACRNLAVNSEESHRYLEVSEFRYWSMKLWSMEQGRGFFNSVAGCLYGKASGYGERIGKALFVLSMIWVTFAFAYLLTRHIQMREWYDIFKALNYSLSVMTLARPDKPAGVLTPALVTFESILGPVQAALLTLAIRRKFMR